MCSTQVAYQCSKNQYIIRSMINARKLKGTWKPMTDSCASLRKTMPSSEATNLITSSMYSLGGCKYELIIISK